MSEESAEQRKDPAIEVKEEDKIKEAGDAGGNKQESGKDEAAVKEETMEVRRGLHVDE